MAVPPDQGGRPSAGLLSPELWRIPGIRPDGRSAMASRRRRDGTLLEAGNASGSEIKTFGAATASPDAMREEFARQIHRKENRWPRLDREPDRRESILEDSVGYIDVADRQDTDPDTPWYSVHDNGYYGVAQNNARILREAERLGIDPDLVRAIMYAEYANGFGYGGPAQYVLGRAESLYPMNIRPNPWQGLAGEQEDLNDPDANVRAGVTLIKRISNRLSDPSIAKIATLYNSLAKDQVTNYGAQVEQIYNDKLWQRPPSRQLKWPYRRQR